MQTLSRRLQFVLLASFMVSVAGIAYAACDLVDEKCYNRVSGHCGQYGPDECHELTIDTAFKLVGTPRQWVCDNATYIGQGAKCCIDPAIQDFCAFMWVYQPGGMEDCIPDYQGELATFMVPKYGQGSTVCVVIV
jgi:hypothetical protein